jgi:hypothetical protein
MDDNPFGPIDPSEAVTIPDFDPCAGYKPRGRYVFQASRNQWIRNLPKTQEQHMPNINDAFPSNYLKASDLQGREAIVTIDRVAFEPVGREKEMKAVCYFAGKQKGIVLNKTNAKKIIEISGSAITEEWSGTQIKIYPTETEFGGETVDCIRVKPVGKSAMSRMTPPPPPPPIQMPPPSDLEGPLTDDDIPFAWLMPLVLPMTGLIGLGMLFA